MRKFLTILVTFLFVISIAGCQKMAEVSWKLVAPEANNGLSYTNEIFSINFSNVLSSLDFSITNNSDSPIRIVWDNCAFTGFNGNPSRVLHYGIRYIEKDRYMPPSVVPSKQTLKESVTPADNVMYLPYFGWTTFAILPITADEEYYGKSFSFLLCYEVNGENFYETFTFIIDKLSEEDTVGSRILIKDMLRNAHIVQEGNEVKFILPLPSNAGISSIFEPNNIEK